VHHLYLLPRRAVLSALLVLSSTIPRASPLLAYNGSTDNDPGSQRIWRTSQKCGLNSLYLCLHAHGYSVNYEDLERTLPIGQRGNTFIELRDAARHFGLNMTVYRCAPAYLSQCTLPAIILLEMPRNNEGHYFVLVRCDESGFQLIDGSLATHKYLTPDEFYRQWTGYILTPSTRYEWAPWVISSGFGLLVLLVYALWHMRPCCRTRLAPDLPIGEGVRT
jgi:hypothetical protein